MITVEELKKKALRLYPQVLAAHVAGEAIFPKALPANRVLPKDFAAMHEALRPVIAHSKERTGHGYTIQYQQVKTRSHGTQTVPAHFTFDSLPDYLKFIGAEKEFGRFREDVALILSEFPALQAYLQAYPRCVIEHHGAWQDIVTVCKWFAVHHQPHTYYIRELPIPVHTKFIEEKKIILQTLLDQVAPQAICADHKDFAIRFGLHYDQPPMRIRILDEDMAIGGQLTDLTLPLSQMAALALQPRRVIVPENKMTFLTLPSMPGTLAIWGHGYRAGLLQHLPWLRDTDIIYWGDLDVHGFQILNQVRSHYPGAKSLMMDKATYRAFRQFVTSGKPSPVTHLPHLTEAEALMHRYLRLHNLRLEQERISHGYVLNRLEEVVE